MRPEAPQKQIKAQVVRTTPVKVTQATKSENPVTQAPIVAAGVVATKAPAVLTKPDDKPAVQVATIPKTVKEPTVVTKSQPVPTEAEPQNSTEKIVVAAVGSIVSGLTIGWLGITWWGKYH